MARPFYLFPSTSQFENQILNWALWPHPTLTVNPFQNWVIRPIPKLTNYPMCVEKFEIVKNDPEAIWLTMPPNYPIATQKMPGPFFSPGDPIIFENLVVCGIGIGDESHMHDLSKPRTSCNEFGVEVLKRMLEPFGIKVETVYFNASYGYHIDCVVSALEEGLLATAEDAWYGPIPEQIRDWEVIPVSAEDIHDGCNNNVPLGNKRIVMLEDTGLGRELNKRGWEVIEVPYRTIYKHLGSGIHCSTMALHRESD